MPAARPVTFAPAMIGTGSRSSVSPMRREKYICRLRSADAAAAAAEAELEDARALEEELALLGKEQRKARQVHDRFVDLRLREIGVDRQFRGQRRRDADLRRLETDVAQRVEGRRAARSRDPRIRRARTA